MLRGGPIRQNEPLGGILSEIQHKRGRSRQPMPGHKTTTALEVVIRRNGEDIFRFDDQIVSDLAPRAKTDTQIRDEIASIFRSAVRSTLIPTVTGPPLEAYIDEHIEEVS